MDNCEQLSIQTCCRKIRNSYAQVFRWVKNYKKNGEDPLIDRRGKRKNNDVLSEIDKLKKENQILKRKTERLEMETEGLKKFQEIERRGALTSYDNKTTTQRKRVSH